MFPDALKIQHVRFQHFQQADDDNFAYFPYSRLKQYDAQEVKEGRQPLFITATYQGKKRPVYFVWSLELHGDVPTAPHEQWMQAVDVSSDDQRPTPDRWVGLDNCAFMYDLYGVVDDNGHFVAGVTWDLPFAQNSDQYLTMIKQFFHKLSQSAPKILVMCNVGSLKDWSQFQSVYADISGIMREDISEANPSVFARAGRYSISNAISWFGSQGRVAVLRALVQPGDPQAIRSAYCIYLLLKGPNFFFAPQYTKTAALAVPPDQYDQIRSNLGEATESMRIDRLGPKGLPYVLYSRNYEGGIVYVNWTGLPQTITLRSDRHYLDFHHEPVKTITVSDLTGTYVSSEERGHFHRSTGK
jgi:hypothetical protein